MLHCYLILSFVCRDFFVFLNDCLLLVVAAVVVVVVVVVNGGGVVVVVLVAGGSFSTRLQLWNQVLQAAGYHRQPKLEN